MIRPTPEATASTTLVPPRPDLGPEPWPDSPSTAPAWPWVALAAVVASIAALALRPVRRRRPVAPGAPAVDGPAPPADPWAGWDRLVRDRLVARWGPAWAAKTAEEMLSSPEISGLPDPASIATFRDFLRRVERAKYAGLDAPAVDPPARRAWDRWAAEFPGPDPAPAPARR